MILEIYCVNGCDMRTLLKNRRIADIVSGTFIILFTYTAVNKFIDYRTSRIAPVQWPIPVNYTDFIAVVSPAAGLLAAVLLVISARQKAGLLFALLFMIDEIFCAQVWTSKTIDNKPAGTPLANLEKPANP